jgi:hypothetical protein
LYVDRVSFIGYFYPQTELGWYRELTRPYFRGGFFYFSKKFKYNLMGNEEWMMKEQLILYLGGFNMRSDMIKKGVDRAPHRSLLYVTGVKLKDLDKPF